MFLITCDNQWCGWMYSYFYLNEVTGFTLVKDRRLDLLDCRLTTACGQCTQDDSKA